MTPEQLKNSILQLAIEGKLVPQDKSEGTGADLLQKIRQENPPRRNRGQEKRHPSQSEGLSVGAVTAKVNSPSNGRGGPILERGPAGWVDEQPFAIPDNWCWCRLGEIALSVQYGYNAAAKQSGQYRMVRITDIQDNNVVWNTVPFCEILPCDAEKYVLLNNDILFARTGGTVGKSFLVKNVPENVIYAGYLIRVRLSNYVDIAYLKLFMETPCYWYQLKEGTIATAQPNCNGQKLSEMVVPLPPLAEQKRIVAKLEELLPLVEEYAKYYDQLQKLNQEFPGKLKKALLQLAIEGKLVPQDKSEGTGADLLKKIRKENPPRRNRGQEKRHPSQSEGLSVGAVTEKVNSPSNGRGGPILERGPAGWVDEQPFVIPDNWCWCRLGEITYNRGQKTPDCDFVYIDIGSIDNVHQKLSDDENIIKKDKAPSRARRIVCRNDILYATVRPYLHNMCIVDRDYSFEPIASTGFAVLSCPDGIVNKYLFYYLLSPSFDSYANNTDNAKGVAYPAINDKKLFQAAVPLPPLAEQKRIVAKLEELLPLCESLESR